MPDVIQISDMPPTPTPETINVIFAGVEVGYDVVDHSFPSQQVIFEGPPGPDGHDAPLPVTYQVSAVSSFYRAHAFGYPPEVTVIEGTAEVVADVTYPDASHVFISFPTPFTGSVVLR